MKHLCRSNWSYVFGAWLRLRTFYFKEDIICHYSKNSPIIAEGLTKGTTQNGKEGLQQVPQSIMPKKRGMSKENVAKTAIISLPAKIDAADTA